MQNQNQKIRSSHFLDAYAKFIKGFPPDHAYEAYKKKYYLEAVGVLHGFIESQMRSIFQAHAIINLKNKDDKTWDIIEKIDFKSISIVLFALQLITKIQLDKLTALNGLRNEIIHKYFYEPFDGSYQGASIIKFASIFKPAYELSWIFNELNEEMHSQ